MARARADELLLRQGLCADREEARRAILAGRVRVGADHLVRGPADTLPAETILSLAATADEVSRAAGKLRPALDAWPVPVAGVVALDLGASTGGFTGLLLQRGAARVYAVDVGRGLLHWRLRQDPRVCVLEGVNARYLTAAQVPEPVGLVTADLAFISLRTVLPAVAPLLAPGGWALLLVKPQFEAARAEVAAGGVVRDPAVRARVVADMAAWCAATLGWEVLGALDSPVPGPKGNVESILVARGPGRAPPGHSGAVKKL